MNLEISAPTLSAQLRSGTAGCHERMEQQLNSVWSDLSLPRYVRLLQRWMGFTQQWESSGQAVFAGELGAFFAARRKAPMIAADLEACGQSAEQIDALPVIPRDALAFADPSAALGILYVIEGSTLGGQIIAKRVRYQVGLTPHAGASYFSSYGANVMPMWRETKQVLDAPPFEVANEAVINGAKATFDFLAKWLRV